jgi:hypothetical protein
MLKVFVQEARTRNTARLGFCFPTAWRGRTIDVLRYTSFFFVIVMEDELSG